jgi:homoserine dehydrogenase
VSPIEVLKFGSSVLRSADDLHVAVDEIYRRWRSGSRVLAVVSAFEGVTDQLFREAEAVFGNDAGEATAAYVATGEQKTAALLVGALRGNGLAARLIEPREIGLVSEGSSLESAPVCIDESALEALWSAHAILVLPGFYGIDAEGCTALFGRGGSDMSALFLAAQLGGKCRLLKDVSGVFDADPARSVGAHRFSALSWTRAVQVAGPLIQPKALQYAQSCALPFSVGRPNEAAHTEVGEPADQWGTGVRVMRPLRIALLGCGVVGRGVYQAIKRYPERFDLRHVVVRDVSRYADVAGITADVSMVLDDSVDAVIECFDGYGLALPLISAALSSGKYVITANQAATAQRWTKTSGHVRGERRRLWFSATAMGAVPVLETLASLEVPVTEIRGIVNGTCGVVLDLMAQGMSCEDALSSADKLALLIEAAFGVWVEPAKIPTRGIEGVLERAREYKLIARAVRTRDGVTASARPELCSPDSFLGSARGAENRVEIDLANGETLRLRGQGAGRWPATVSVMGDLHEVARLVEAGTPV